MWSKKYNNCIKCGTSENKYKGKGMCCLCYFKDYNKKYYKNNIEKIKEKVREYRIGNLEKAKEWNKKHYQKNKNEKIFKDEKRKRHLSRLHSDLRYRLKCNISTSIYNRLRRHFSSKNGKSTFSFLPYTIDDLIQHLENQFKLGMNWTNYGDWHIDHKIPDCKFNYKSVDDEEFKKCWALDNLQPLWAEENLKKGGRI